ncbi:MAG: DUF4159 domain-containing protein [Gemmatimonadota bacterium]
MRHGRWLTVAILLFATAAVIAAQGRGRRRSPGMDPNPNVTYDGRFTFVRMKFTPLGWDLGWDHDYPTAEQHFMRILDELTTVAPNVDGSNIHGFDDPELFRYPFAYVSEPGQWTLSPDEVVGLRNYIEKGGFLVFDDFAGPRDWFVFTSRWQEVFPSSQIVRLDTTHAVFDSFYRIQTFNFTDPQSGDQSEFWGAFENNDPTKRLLMVANFNNDIGDYMEWSNDGVFPISVTNEAYKLAVNYAIYAMTH